MNVQNIDNFHKTRLGYLVFGLGELGLSYLFFSWALSSGNLWQYVVAIIFIFGFLQNAVRMIGVHKK